MLKSHDKFHSSNGKRLILIVDDEPINRELLGLMLQNEYETLTAPDGESALAIIREKYEVLSLILLDLLMPGMNGLELIRILKDDPLLKNIPVIVLTADQEAEVTSLKLGAADFIPKPYPKQEIILTRVVRAIELTEDRDIILSTERDHLTGLYNRDYFYRYAQQLDQHHKDTDMDAIVLDIYHFRMINERYGKAYGDEVLRRIGEKVRGMVTAEGGIVCRREADTFLVYCPHREDYDAFLENAAVGLAGDNASSNRVRLRMGVYAHVDKELEIERRFDRAKAAADTVRSNLLRGVGFYDSRLHDSEVYAEQLLEGFEQAIKERQFTVFYQPKFDVRPEIPVLASAEALVRWKHPTLGMISPGMFIPLFEENGLIQQLDLYVWNEAARQINDWKTRLGISVPVSVNVSRIDMYDPNLIGTFQGILQEHGLEPNELLLEITESAYTQDSAQIIRTVNDLRSLGFLIEMDDFGTGYSSLNMISSLPIDALKLDMKFIRDAFRDGRDTRLIEVIIDIADYLSVPVIAEGVETEEQLDVLRGMGCDIVQGYYFSKPIPAEEYEVFIEQKKTAGPQEPEAVTVVAESGHKSEVSPVIAHALTTGFEMICYIDTETGQYVQFSAKGRSEDLQIERSGKDFFRDVENYIGRVIYEDDRERVLLSMRKEALLTQLYNGQSFSMTYRFLVNDQPVYYNLRAVNAPSRDDHHIVIGVSNIDDQIHAGSSDAASEKNREIFNIAQALSSDFETIYYVDLQTDTYTEYTVRTPSRDLQVEENGKDFFEACQRHLLKMVFPEDQEAVSAALRRETLLSQVADKTPFTMVLRLTLDGQPDYYLLKAVLTEEGQHLVVGVSNIHDRYTGEGSIEAAMEPGLTYARIAQALARDYFRIFLVSTETGAYTRYASGSDAQELRVQERGTNFFDTYRSQAKKMVYKEDLDTALALWNKEKILTELEQGNVLSSTYRIYMDDVPVFVNSKIMGVDDDNGKRYILIGISNVDDQMKRERELLAAREKVNRDALTGVKSKHAYLEAAEDINQKISDGSMEPFAIVFCDVNDLKATNDTQGHQAGDRLIQAASRLICNTFKHSPIYRIGGDEFVAILKGSDYEQMEELLNQMEALNLENRQSGNVIVACGSSQWDPQGGQTFEDVFERADAAMYRNKGVLKSDR